ncbi:MAG: C1 family peptidase [Candidatus Xenobia bacterium]
MMRRMAWLGGLLLLLSGFGVAAERWVTVNSVNRARATAFGERLRALDLAARDAFAAAHPGVLPELRIQVPESPPPAFDWTALDMVCGLKRQHFMDCWDVGATKALECSEIRINGLHLDLSPQPVLDAARSFSLLPLGATPFAFNHFVDFGTTTEDAWPYTGQEEPLRDVPTPYRAIAWGFVGPPWRFPPIAAIKAALLKYGPLEVGISYGEAFSQFRGHGVLEDLPELELTGGHSVLLVGWDDARGKGGAWRIMNHSTKRWGDHGFGWLGYHFTHFGRYVAWVRAQSLYYPVPAELRRLLPDATPFPPPRLGDRP